MLNAVRVALRAPQGQLQGKATHGDAGQVGVRTGGHGELRKRLKRLDFPVLVEESRRRKYFLGRPV